MSEETENGQIDTATTQATPVDTPTQETQAKETYQGPVDLSTLPEDIRGPIEARLSTLTKKMGSQERRYENRISERDALLAEQSKIIEELQSGMGLVVDHLQGKSLAERETSITQELTRAHETGDVAGFIKANNDMQRLQAEKLQTEQRQKQQPKKERTQPAAQNGQQYRSANDMASADEAEGGITSDEAKIVGAWQSEKDANGQTLRPWTVSRAPAGQDPTSDARYRRAVTISAEVFDDDPDSGNPFAGRSVAEKLAEVDKRMGVTKSTQGQSVLGGNLTNRGKSPTLRLTAGQEQIALKTKFAGPGKSDAEHLAAYKAQVEKVKGQRK